MLFGRPVRPEPIIGRPAERLTLDESKALVGKVVAIERYTPEATPLRTIQGIGDSAEECIAQLAGRGLDPFQFEFIMLKPPF
jgi:hypothetical protein